MDKQPDFAIIDEKSSLVLWPDDSTEALIKAWAEYQSTGVINLKATHWNTVAAKVNAIRSGVAKTAQQCRNKMDNMKKTYRRNSTEGPQSGQGAIAWKWYDILSQSLQFSSKHNGKGIPGAMDGGILLLKEFDDQEFENLTEPIIESNDKSPPPRIEEEARVFSPNSGKSVSSQGKKRNSPEKQEESACNFPGVKGKSVGKKIETLDTLPSALKTWASTYNATEITKVRKIVNFQNKRLAFEEKKLKQEFELAREKMKEEGENKKLEIERLKLMLEYEKMKKIQ
jgi:Myb/SANT-like DNA-binding domain